MGPVALACPALLTYATVSLDAKVSSPTMRYQTYLNVGGVLCTRGDFFGSQKSLRLSTGGLFNARGELDAAPSGAAADETPGPPRGVARSQPQADGTAEARGVKLVGSSSQRCNA